MSYGDFTHGPNATVPGIGPGGWDSGKLAQSQETQAEREGRIRAKAHGQTVVYRLYIGGVSGFCESLVRLVSRYFEGATILYGVGVWNGATEHSAMVEIIGDSNDLQTVAHLAGDIRLVHGQTAVLVTWTPVNQLLITKDDNAS